MRCFLSVSLSLTTFDPHGRCMSSLQYETLLQLIDCSALRSIPITGTSSLLWLLLTSHSSLLLGFILCETSQLKVRTLSPSSIRHIYFVSTNVITIRLCCILPTYLSKPSLICDFCPSDRGFAYNFLQISSRNEHPCCSAMHFPLSGRARDFHPLEFAHVGRTKLGIQRYKSAICPFDI